MELVTRKTKQWWEAWNFQAYAETSPNSKKRRGAGNWINDWSYLCDEASIKIPKVWGSESFWVGECFCIIRGWHTLAPWGQKLLHLGPFWTSSYVLLHSAVHSYSYYILYNQLRNVNSISLSSVRYSSRLSSPKRRSWKPRFIRGWSEVQVTTWYLQLVTEVRAVFWDWGLNLWDLMLTHVDGVGIVGHPADVSENCLVWEKPTCLVLEVFVCVTKGEIPSCLCIH